MSIASMNAIVEQNQNMTSKQNQCLEIAEQDWGKSVEQEMRDMKQCLDLASRVKNG